MSKTRPGRIFASGDATKLYLTLPAAIDSDSQSPLAPDETVQVTIDDSRCPIAHTDDSTGSTL